LATTKIYNTVTDGSVNFNANVGGTETTLLTLNGSTGEVSVNQSPTTTMGVATKLYSDSSISTAILPLAPKYSPTFTGTPLAPNASVVTDRTGQIATMNSVWGAIDAGFNDTVLQGSIQIWANAITPIQSLSVDSITGEITIAVDPSSDMGIATKQYVDDSISTALVPMATINSPSFTGSPTAPNVASSSDRTTKIATTAFVQNAITNTSGAKWLGSNKTVSTDAPSGGNSGDFWFQI
jgi:hypothetical protein